jgi:hypothetical protein
MTKQHPITPPPPHLLKKFSAQAQAEANKRNGTGYLKTVATLCIEWFVNSQSTSNDRQIRSSEITPPPELVQRLSNSPESWLHQITNAYQAGADQELEACAQWVEANFGQLPTHNLHQFRRPKAPSLKEQALADLDSMSIEPCLVNGIDANALVRAKYDNIRRALEALDD